MKTLYGINLVHSMDADMQMLSLLATGYRHGTSSHSARQQQERDRVLQARLGLKDISPSCCVWRMVDDQSPTMVNFWSQAGGR
ncbi:hypothetical protein NS1_04 [Citrobacter phage NS1]|uniref:Uncharacterized protein n=1 Tax=Citrobacter phage NS1 TaxID=2766968 RepID=A0A7G9IRB8_9CAUD